MAHIPKAPNVLGNKKAAAGGGGGGSQPPGPGQSGWNPSKSYARTSVVAPPPWEPPPDPGFIDRSNIYQRDRGNLIAQYGDPSLGADAPFAQRYGYQGQTLASEFGANADGVIDWSNIDVGNPYGRAQLLVKNYQEGQRGNKVGTAARGQLYSGSLETAQQQGTRRFDAAKDETSRSFSRSLNAVSQQATQGLSGLDSYMADANEDHRQFVESQKPTSPAVSTRQGHPVVLDTIKKAEQLWNSGKKKGTQWRDIISILGYDPRAGGGLNFK